MNATIDSNQMEILYATQVDTITQDYTTMSEHFNSIDNIKLTNRNNFQTQLNEYSLSNRDMESNNTNKEFC